MEKETDHANGSPDSQQLEAGDPVDTMDEQEAAKEKLTGSEKITFTAINLSDGKNGEAKIDIQMVQTTIGMGKEELMKYANEPFWVRLRLFLFILFWVGWVAMLVGAVVIILIAPRCPPAPKLEWYQKTVMYQVEVDAFKDSDNDDVGDLKGLKESLQYFTQINVKTLLISAIYAMAPGTNGILNHTSINDKLGTMTDMDELLVEAEKKDLKIIMDFIPNHSSDEHPWFKSSVKRESPYEDFYVWADGKQGSNPPSNWLSVKGGSAWEWNDERKQFYLHTFTKNEPDLNLRNEAVREKLKEILRFWLDKGVHGFKVISASHLIEDETFKDEPLGIAEAVSNAKYEDLAHAFTVDQPENIELFSEWRELLSNYSASTGSRKILLAEVSGEMNKTLKYYGDNESLIIVDFPITRQLTELTENSTPEDLKDKLNNSISVLKNNTWPNWLLGDHNTERLANRVGPELIDGIHMVAMLSKGTPITYFGDEMGMTESSKLGKPMLMPWSNATSEGNSVNVEAQLQDANSHLKIFSNLIALRNQPAINFGIQEYPVITDKIFSMIRVRKGVPGYMVILHMGMNSTVVDFTDTSKYLPDTAKVEFRSQNIDSGPLFDPKIKLNGIPLNPKQSVILSFVPKFKD